MNDHDMKDHDLLIELRGEVNSLTQTVTTNAQRSAERDARLEARMEFWGTQVEAHDRVLTKIEDRQVRYEPVWARHNLEHVEMWNAYKFGRWLVPLLFAIVGGLIVAIIRSYGGF